MRNELRKESFFNDLESILDDVELLLKDYGCDVSECMEDESLCEEQDEDIYNIINLYCQIRETIENSR